MLLTGNNISFASSNSHLAKVYPKSTSMQLAWVADPFLSDCQKRSPQSFALPTEHISYVRCTCVFCDGFRCMSRLLTQSPRVFGVLGSDGSWSQAFADRFWLMYTIRIVCFDTLNWLQWLPFQFWELIRVSAVSKFKESAGETRCRWK